MATMNRPKETQAHRRTALVQVVGALLVGFTILATTLSTTLGARGVVDKTADSVGRFYLQELAGHSSQVITSELNLRFDHMRRAMAIMAEEDVSTQDKLRDFIAKIEGLYGLEQLAVVDEDDIVYARYATYMGASRYSFLSDGSLDSEGVMSSTSFYGASKQVCLAIPITGLSAVGKPLKACFVEVDINSIVSSLSGGERNVNTAFCLYHQNGKNLTRLSFGPFDASQNLLRALQESVPAQDLEKLRTDFQNGNDGVLDFSYKGSRETLYYEPIPGSNWMFTVLVADNLIQEQIRSAGDEMLMRSTVQIVVTALALLLFFVALVRRLRRESKEALEKERQRIKDVDERAKQSERELGTVREVAYKDVLTGVNSRYSFAKEQLVVEEGIKTGTIQHYAVVIFDVNKLKLVNDLQGHAAGDEYIKAACKLICDSYVHSPVYRIGGDEFAVLLRGHDYDYRTEIHDAFERKVEENLAQGKVVVASGMAEYRPGDTEFQDVMTRADKRMYVRKAQLEKS